MKRLNLYWVGVVLGHLLLISTLAAQTSASKADKESDAQQNGKHQFLAAFAHNGKTGEVEEGEIRITDPEKGRQVGQLKTALKGDTNYTSVTPGRRYNFTIEVPGFHKTKKTIDFSKLEKSGIRHEIGEDSAVIFHFELERPHPGETVTYHRIYFWDNTAIMLPAPKNDRKDLLAFLKENPGAEIRIHGHTKENFLKKVKKPLRQNGELKPFLLSRENEETLATAKKLSELRAKTLKGWLVKEGIAADRIQAEGHGNKDPLYHEDSSLYYKNDRIEIEVLAY